MSSAIIFPEDEVIVSKTDTRGIITYVNRTFLEVSGYRRHEIMGKPHNYIRHPNMPKAVFKLLWDRLKSGQEIFAYVVNRAKNDDYYWVLAHVTPTFDDKGAIIGFHSNRRSPRPEAIKAVEPLYKKLCEIEASAATSKEAVERSGATLNELLQQKNTSYDEFVLSL